MVIVDDLISIGILNTLVVALRNIRELFAKILRAPLLVTILVELICLCYTSQGLRAIFRLQVKDDHKELPYL